MARIRIEPESWEVIARHARATYPEECCGVLLGHSGENGTTVRLAYPVENTAPASRGSRYEIANSDILSAQTKAAGLGMSLLGIYHSHPDHGAGFSAPDLEASCPWLSYVVISVRRGRVAEIAGWTGNFEQTEARREDVEILAGSDSRRGWQT